MDENPVAGVTGGPELLVPRSIAAAAAQIETAYSEMPEPMADLLQCIQKADPFSCEVRRHGGEVSRTHRGVRKASQGKSKAKDSPWEVSTDDLLRYEGHVYVPQDPAVRMELLRVNHDDPQGGHQSSKRTLSSLRLKYYWHGMAKDVEEYCKTCDPCQRARVHCHKPYGMLEPLPTPQGPMDSITLDFITGLPPSQWINWVYDAILVIVDRYTKFAMYLPCSKTIDAPAFADLLFDRWVSMFGMPKNIISDRGSLFTSHFWSTLCHWLSVRRRLSTAYHPQTDGQTERQNQTMERYLRIYCNFEQDDWAHWLPLAQLCYNTSPHSSTGITPNQALMDFNPDLKINVDIRPLEGEAPHATVWTKHMQEIRSLLEQTLVKSTATQKKYYDQHHQPKTFQIGDQVMLNAKNIRQL